MNTWPQVDRNSLIFFLPCFLAPGFLVSELVVFDRKHYLFFLACKSNLILVRV